MDNDINIPDKYFHDFTRGFFDGDGTVYIYKVNKVSQIKAGFLSTSFVFLRKFNKQLCKNLNVPEKNINQKIDRSGEPRLVQYTVDLYIDDCEKLAKFMYQKNSSLCLARKRKVFERWQSVKRRGYSKQNYPSKICWRLNNPHTTA